MASPNERTRNNVRMGVFVTFALLLAVGIIFALSDVWTRVTQRTDEWTVRFHISSGVSHIKPGSEVRVGGLEKGSVRRVELHVPDDPDASFEHVDVVFRLDQGVQLYSNAVILASSQVIGAEGWIDILSVGTREAGPPQDGMIEGEKTLGMLASILGPEAAAKTREFIASIPDEYHDRFVPILEDVKDTSGRVRVAVAEFTEETWPTWRGEVDLIMANVSSATGKADEFMDRANAIAGEVSDVIDENRPQLHGTLANAEELTSEWIDMTHHLREEIVPKVTNMLDRGQDGLDRAVVLLRRLQEDYEGWSVTFGEALAAANLTGQQLKLASIELRRAPWKLLHRPSRRELEHELLYEAARSFALAAADLKAASKSAQRVLDAYGDELMEDPEARQRVKRALLDQIEDYAKAQERLMDILFIEAPQ